MERMSIMNTRKSLTKRKADTGPKSPLKSEGFACIDPTQRSIVYDFFKGFHQEEKMDVVAHLGLCLQCRESVATMIELNKYLHPAQRNYLHPERSGEVTSETQEIAVYESD
jgi:hypothetical protein